jgi:hypothetical protein
MLQRASNSTIPSNTGFEREPHPIMLELIASNEGMCLRGLCELAGERYLVRQRRWGWTDTQSACGKSENRSHLRPVFFVPCPDGGPILSGSMFLAWVPGTPALPGPQSASVLCVPSRFHLARRIRTEPLYHPNSLPGLFHLPQPSMPITRQ